MVEKKKTKIDGSSSLMEYLKEYSPKNIGVKKTGVWDRKNRVVRKTFKNIKFIGDLHDIEFRSVKFIDCEFEGVFGFFCMFYNCVFENSRLINSRFSHMEFGWHGVQFIDSFIRNVELDEGSVSALIFINSTMMSSNLAGLFNSENIRFYDSTIEDTNFLPTVYYEEEKVNRDDDYIDLLFEDCVINNSTFQEMNFKNSRFINTVLYKCAFLDCILENESFKVDKKLKYPSFASIDFQTILKSEELNTKILSTYFNINTKANIKKTISKMTEKLNLHTVFISYSFHDSIIAKRINNSLRDSGIRTFMWEKDAPAGKRLEEIMTSGIKAHDKLLFIASENSIKSKACQFELTTARNKQEQSWENVFFPIKIDDFIFNVKKSQIRPTESADEYWKNIEEIKMVNMLDFSPFKHEECNETEYNVLLKKIIEGLYPEG